MSKEVKIGAISILTLLFAIWGYTFVKGKNLLSQATTLYTIYEDVTSLTVSSPVMINGYNVGAVKSIEINPKDVGQMIVGFDVEGKIKIPKGTEALMISGGIVGGKAIQLSFDQLCEGDDCAQDGDFLEGRSIGLLGTMLPKDELNEYVTQISDGFSKALEKIGQEDSEGVINQTVQALQKTMQNLADLTETSNKMLAQSSRDITETMKNMSAISGNLANNNDKISNIINSMDELSSGLKDADLGGIMKTSGQTVEETKTAIKQLQSTLESANKSMLVMEEVMLKFNNGNGSLSRLLNDRQLYDNIEKTSKNLSLLLQDLRLNPKRYINVSVFGGGDDKEYVKPENDPAFDEKN